MFFELITNSRRRTGPWISKVKYLPLGSSQRPTAHPPSSPAPRQPAGRHASWAVSTAAFSPSGSSPHRRPRFPAAGRTAPQPRRQVRLPGQPEVKATAAWRMDLWKLGGLVLYLVCPAWWHVLFWTGSPFPARASIRARPGRGAEGGRKRRRAAASRASPLL